MTKPQWADAVSEWVSPDAWRLSNEPVLFVDNLGEVRNDCLAQRWSAWNRDRSCIWVVDVWSGPTQFVSSVWLRDQSCDVQCRGERVEPMADVFRRLKAAHSVARAQ